jgi:hypothetical protein
MEFLRPAIERSHGRWNLRYVLAALCRGDHQLWVAYEADGTRRGAMTTQILEYPCSSWVAVHFLGGDAFEQWCDAMLDMLESYAKRLRCDGIETSGRHGFWPFFKRRGYGRSYTVYDRVFGEES